MQLMVSLVLLTIFLGIFAFSFGYTQLTQETYSSAPFVSLAQADASPASDIVRVNGTVVGTPGTLVASCSPPAGEYQDYWYCQGAPFDIYQGATDLIVNTGYLLQFMDWPSYQGGKALIESGDTIAVAGKLLGGDTIQATYIGQEPSQFAPPSWQGPTAEALVLATAVGVILAVGAYVWHKERVRAHVGAKWDPSQFAPSVEVRPPPS